MLLRIRPEQIADGEPDEISDADALERAAQI